MSILLERLPVCTVDHKEIHCNEYPYKYVDCSFADELYWIPVRFIAVMSIRSIVAATELHQTEQYHMSFGIVWLHHPFSLLTLSGYAHCACVANRRYVHRSIVALFAGRVSHNADLGNFRMIFPYRKHPWMFFCRGLGTLP